MFLDRAETGITPVDLPLDLVRTTSPRYLDQARADFDDYVRKTLTASQALGGRYNPAGEFGALYCASDEQTAWDEIAARFRREGIPGLPNDMGLLGVIVREGGFVDLTDARTRALWGADGTALDAPDPTLQQCQACHATARAVRAVADFLWAPSARASGANVPLFPDREGGTIRFVLASAALAHPPAHLRQVSGEAW